MPTPSATDTGFAGSIPSTYERYMVPLLFRPYAELVAQKAQALHPRRILETAAGTGVLTQTLLIALVLVPGDVAVMGTGQKRVPVFERLLLLTHVTIATRSHVCAAVEEGTGVARVVQHLQRAGVNQIHPEQFSATDAAPQSSGKEQSVIAEMLHRRTSRARLFEGREEGL